MGFTHALVLTAAGSSSRFSSLEKKEFSLIQNCTVLEMALKPFLEVSNLVAVVITYKEGLLEETRKAIKNVLLPQGCDLLFVKGGQTRQESVYNGLLALENKNIDLVSIHDGARPFVTKKLIEKCLKGALEFDGAVPGVSMTDTLVTTNELGILVNTLDRSKVFGLQTPQVFNYKKILEAHKKASNNAESFTDDTQVFRTLGYDVLLIEGERENIKITFQKDLGDCKC
ncbi:MAG: 2-C-methyl-D-erythritol 4-phosphate cytidylyltransferase [Sphaerochaetaceae bacterium]|nr:2-C-methyl-D-erythritol 4-phosphate cytidylyltransferase [Sphaerochaetaceae bacterium]